MATKKELEKSNADLRQQVLNLKESLAKYKKVDPDNIDFDFDKVGVGIKFSKEHGYSLIELRYNEALGNGIVFCEHKSTPDNFSRALLEQNAVQFLLENIVDIEL